jgi:hypothetical protein
VLSLAFLTWQQHWSRNVESLQKKLRALNRNPAKALLNQDPDLILVLVGAQDLDPETL